MSLRIRFTIPLLAILVVLILSLGQQQLDMTTVSEAQSNDAACNQLVQAALDEVANNCLDLGRNEICYGNNHVSATFSDSSDPNLFFESPGDIVPLTALEAIVTRPVDLEGDEWGIALMDLEADLPSGDDSLRLVLFGDVEVTPVQSELIENAPTCTYTSLATDSMNMRAGPGTGYGIVNILEQGESIVVMGQNPAGDWVRSSRGWIYEPFGTLECGENTLRTIENTADAYVAPMQAFSLQINEDAQCETAPSGMLVQAPSGQTANIMVNNVEIRVGSTAFIGLPLEPNEESEADEFIVANIQGDVQLTRGTRTQGLVAGTQVAIETDTDGNSRIVGIRTPFYASGYHLDDLLSRTLRTIVSPPPPEGATGGNGGGGSSGGNRLDVPDVPCRVGQTPGSAAQYFSSNNASIVSFNTSRSGSAASITLETQVTARSISYMFSCNSPGIATFTTTITDSNGQTVSDTFTVTVQ